MLEVTEVARAHPPNDDEFEERVERVDSPLREEECPIAGRPLRAIGVVARELREELIVAPLPERPPRAGCYTGDDLSIRTSAWFDDRYGDRLLVDMSPGRAVILLRGDPWLLKVPALYGSWEIASEDQEGQPTEGIVRVSQRGRPQQPLKHNCLRSIVALPDKLRLSLRPSERGRMILLFEL